MSPVRNKSSEKMTKKSHRKLDMNIKKSSQGQRKKSSSSKSNQKVGGSFISSTNHKKSFKHLTRNPSKNEGFESSYSVLMETYTELMTKKRNAQKQTHRKELSQSFHLGQK